MSKRPNAEVIILKQADKRVMEFHRYAARLRARGNVVSSGDLLTAYKVASTVPDGPVFVTDTTEFVFSS